jgi:hypothetical protein
LSVHVTVLVVGDGLLMVPEQSHPERPLEALEQEALSSVASCEQVDPTGAASCEKRCGGNTVSPGDAGAVASCADARRLRSAHRSWRTAKA